MHYYMCLGIVLTLGNVGPVCHCVLLAAPASINLSRLASKVLVLKTACVLTSGLLDSNHSEEHQIRS